MKTAKEVGLAIFMAILSTIAAEEARRWWERLRG